MVVKFLGRHIAAATLALLGAGFLACGGDDDGDDGPDCSTVTLTYANFGKPLIDRSCISCHAATPIGNTVRLDTLPAVKAATHGIMERAVDLSEQPTMPYLMDPLPAAERENLGVWLDCGAPP
jgi:uncharacterized membrane protein